MKYVNDRYHTNSVKWDGLETFFGASDALPMWVADMDFLSPAPVIEALKKRAADGIFGYSLPSDSYYHSIMNWMDRRHNWKIEKDWIVNCPGVVPALSLIVQEFTDPGDKVIIQTPVYPPFHSVVKDFGRELVVNPLQLQDGTYEIDFEDLKAKIDENVKMLIFCSPHNPVGRVWTKQELEKLADMCVQHNILLVSDEIHADLVYENHTHIPVATISEEIQNLSIICTAPSKTFNIAGLHSANIIIPNKKIRTKFKNCIQRYHIGSISPFSLVATEAAYNEGEEWLHDCLQYMKENIKYVEHYIKTYLPALHVIVPEGTYLLWIDFRNLGMQPKELAAFLLKEAKLALNEGSTFGIEGVGFMRMNIACSYELIQQALVQLRDAIQNRVVK
ncbi:MalY/PatB family protein [Ectobacillus sp. sgz5001026]|uniref:MalY/PatB family protein n=1 Tax=Ectobacillus sp. sgz5001026 TaxID=3242473 RepID=UPI0036D25C5D